jgi:hypothetical protein
MYNLFSFHLLYFCAHDKWFWTLFINSHKNVGTKAYHHIFKNLQDTIFLMANNYSIKIISRFIIEKFPGNNEFMLSSRKVIILNLNRPGTFLLLLTSIL